jgi:uncharacterized protein (TIGR03435 family)
VKLRRFAGIVVCAIWAVAPMLAFPRTSQVSSATGSPAFDIVSVKQNKSGEPAYRATSNIPLGFGDSYAPAGGLFSATNHFVADYIGFAYKLNSYQKRALESQFPKWAKDERFDIEARADGNPSEDQIRLMMRAVLADRFKLAVHAETREGPMFAMVLEKPGDRGPSLQLRSAQSEPCGAFTTSASARSASGVPSACDVFLTLVDGGHSHLSARDVSTQMIADWLMGSFDRPIIDRTGLHGLYDISLEWTTETTSVPAQSEPGATFLQALNEQLGLKLESTRGAIETLTIDHLEEPSAN